jgi:hypothetical protein
MKALVSLSAGLWLLAPTAANAYATFEIRVSDPAGVGFNDEAPADPIAGNTETTVGAQRLAALQHAADLWGALIDSDQTILVEAFFEPLGCGSGSTLAGLGGGNFLIDGVDRDGGDPTIWYPSALADRLMGEDQTPGDVDIVISFNGEYDTPGCPQWYLGFDANAEDGVDMVSVALHELGHGLGFTSYTSRTTGEFSFGAPGPFDRHLFDRDAALHWHEMDDVGRLASVTNARGLAWNGAHGRQAAAAHLEAGAPVLTTTPNLGLLMGALSQQFSCILNELS